MVNFTIWSISIKTPTLCKSLICAVLNSLCILGAGPQYVMSRLQKNVDMMYWRQLLLFLLIFILRLSVSGGSFPLIMNHHEKCLQPLQPSKPRPSFLPPWLASCSSLRNKPTVSDLHLWQSHVYGNECVCVFNTGGAGVRLARRRVGAVSFSAPGWSHY